MGDPLNPMECPGWKAGWKVVSEDHNGHLWSCGHSPTHPILSSQYGTGLLTSRPTYGGPLCVFEDAATAHQFMIENYDDPYSFDGVAKILHPCWYLPSKEGAVWRPPLLPTIDKVRGLVDLPIGTVLAEGVVLCGQPFYTIHSARHRIAHATTNTFTLNTTVTCGSF